MTKYDWNACSNIKCITSQFHELVTPFPKEWFGERKVPFEDIEVIVPSNAEAYCEKMYGDYTRLPPEKDRHPRHNTVLIDLENSYTKYKGKFYCVGSAGKKVDQS